MSEARDDAVDPVESTRMTFGEHLDELRSRLLRAVGATLVALVVTSIYASELMRVVTAPFQRVMRELHFDPTLKLSGPTQGFVTYFKISLMAALAVAAPVWLHQLWAFVAAGLYEKERRPVRRYFPLSLALFAGGTLFGYFVLLPIGLRYLMTFADADLVQNWTGMSEYLSLFFTLTLLLGATFELPVVMLGLAKAGIVGSQGFRKRRRLVILGIFIVAGVVTPPDPITQSLVAIPLCGLYELGILGAMAAEGRRRDPIDWRKAWSRLRWIVVALGLAFVFREKIARSYRGLEADGKVESASDDTGLPWREPAREILRAEPEGAYRVSERTDETLLAVVGGGRAALLRFRPSNERSLAVRADSRRFEILAVQAGAVLWRADLPDDVPESVVVEPLIAALENAGDATRLTARRLALALGAPAGDADDAVAAARVREWLAARPGRAFAQPPP